MVRNFLAVFALILGLLAGISAKDMADNAPATKVTIVETPVTNCAYKLPLYSLPASVDSNTLWFGTAYTSCLDICTSEVVAVFTNCEYVVVGGSVLIANLSTSQWQVVTSNFSVVRQDITLYGEPL